MLIIIIIDNFCIALFSGVHKLTALYNIYNMLGAVLRYLCHSPMPAFFRGHLCVRAVCVCVCVSVHMCFRTLRHLYTCSFTGTIPIQQLHCAISMLAASLGQFSYQQLHWDISMAAVSLGHLCTCSFTGTFLCLHSTGTIFISAAMLGHSMLSASLEHFYTCSFIGTYLCLQLHWAISILAASLGHIYACSFTGPFLCLQLHWNISMLTV